MSATDGAPEGTMFALPCRCWTWAITPDMGDYCEDATTGISHHPRCDRVAVLRALEVTISPARGEGDEG